MDIELLRTFLEVSRTRHFGQAAESLHLTQAAVSARIKTLEQFLGVRLFDRVKRDIRLTPEGNRLVQRADRLISEWRRIRQEISVGGADKQLSVGGSLRLWDVLLQSWLIKLRSKRPELAIIAESNSPEMLTRRLLDGVLDLAFMLEPPQLDLLNIHEIGTLSLCLISSQPSLSADEALGEGYLMVDWGWSHALKHRRLFPDAPEPHTRLSTAALAMGYIQSIGGSAYLPLTLVSSALEEGTLFLVSDAPVIEYQVNAVYPVRSGRKELIKEVLNYFHVE